MRFLADMGVSLQVVEWLREQGHDAVHLREQGLQRLPDPQIFSKGTGEDRIILAFDLDFGEIAALAEGRKTSLILFRLRNTRTPHVVQRLATALANAREALQEGCIVVVEEARIRIRELPG